MDGQSALHFLVSGFQLVLIDLLLAGDNALVIAMAVRSLPPRERKIGIVGGAGVAVVLRIVLTWFAARLLTLEYVQLAGGLLVLWIAVKVLSDASEELASTPSPAKFYEAIWYIVVADITISTDNILAIAGASQNHLGLIVFGLAVSIPFVVLSSNLLANMMERYPWTIYLGSAILGRVGAEMILNDPLAVRTLHPGRVWHWAAQGIAIVLVVVIGWLVSQHKSSHKSKA